MDLFERFRKLDSSLQRGLDNGFARVFGGEVVPAEIDELLKQQAESAVMMDPDNNRWAPCHYTVVLSPRDFESLATKHPGLQEDLSDRLQRFIRNSGWLTNSPVQVVIDADATLHSGQLKANSLFNSPQPAQSPFTPNQPRYSNGEFDPVKPNRSTQGDGDGSADGATANTPAGAHSAGQSRPSSGEFDAVRVSEKHNPYAAGGLSSVVQPAPGFQQGWSGAEERAGGVDKHPGETAYGPGPDSYPGTEVMAEERDQPITGGTGEQPEAETEVTLILRDGSDRRYRLRQGSNIIGRGNGVDLRIPDTGVSRQHADIAWDGYDAVLTDLQSTNGTSVNDTPIENWLLADGDVIVLGHSEIEVSFK